MSDKKKGISPKGVTELSDTSTELDNEFNKELYEIQREIQRERQEETKKIKTGIKSASKAKGTVKLIDRRLDTNKVLDEVLKKDAAMKKHKEARKMYIRSLERVADEKRKSEEKKKKKEEQQKAKNLAELLFLRSENRTHRVGKKMEFGSLDSEETHPESGDDTFYDVDLSKGGKKKTRRKTTKRKRRKTRRK